MGYHRNANKRDRKNRTVRCSGEILRFLTSKDTTGGMRLVKLWRNWRELLGDMADMARPLGHRDKTLILAAMDPVVMQEGPFLAPLILEKINTFFGEEVFDKVAFELLNGRVPLDRQKSSARTTPAQRPEKPRVLGTLNERLDEDSPVGRCYRAYQKVFSED